MALASFDLSVGWTAKTPRLPRHGAGLMWLSLQSSVPRVST
jgi:hypothetical protein